MRRPCRRPPAGPTSWPGRGHDAERAGRDHRGAGRRDAASLHLPVWPFWMAGAACEAVCAPLGIEPPLYRRRVDFFTKSRAFDISRARTEIRLRAGHRSARGHRPHARLVPRGRMAVMAGRHSARRRTSCSRPGESPREKYARADRRPARLGRAAQVRARAAAVAEGAGRARARAAQDALSARCSARAAANVVFGQNVVLAPSAQDPHRRQRRHRRQLPARRQGRRPTPASRIGSGVFVGRNTILSCKNGDIALGDGANIGFNCEIFSASRVTIGRDTLLAAYCYVIGGDHDFRDASRPVLEQGRACRRRRDRRGRVAWRGREDSRRRDDRRSTRSSARARSCARRFRTGAIAVGVPARVVGPRDGDPARPRASRGWR